MQNLEMLSIDLSNFCSKQCAFCYNHSHKDGNVMWTPEEVVAFASDCIAHGVKAVSLGGGEPFEYDGVFDIIEALYPKCYLTATTNGLPLEDEAIWKQLLLHRPDKIHISIHNPDNTAEVSRVIRQMNWLKENGIKPGANLLVSNKKLAEAEAVYSELEKVVSRDQIIVIPQRFSCTPSAKELAQVAGKKPFQSPSCLLGCQKPANFASVSWNKKVSNCSYTSRKGELKTLNYEGLIAALQEAVWENGGCKR